MVRVMSPATDSLVPAQLAELVERLDRQLPQTQCTQCGFDGCRAYAQAIALERADINRCPPGGARNIAALSRITGRAARPLDPACGIESPRRVARIDAERCIGCTKCIQACPVDAVIGGPRWLHAVITIDCTGCELCVAPCPVDCIRMGAPDGDPADWTERDAHAARERHAAHLQRLGRRAAVGGSHAAGIVAARRGHTHDPADEPPTEPSDEFVPPAPTDAAVAARKQALLDRITRKARERLGRT